MDVCLFYLSNDASELSAKIDLLSFLHVELWRLRMKSHVTIDDLFVGVQYLNTSLQE